ncbi:MAG: YqaJ viral recombinase family protein [Proteobacteria bacterium]|nr:YqaJ viral recombinase family protein [Pseudomonadota bacterium]
MIWHNVEQNSPEWDALKLGKASSSGYAKFMANFGKPFGEPAHRYALQIALERITGRKAESSFQNEHMERGHEQEPVARMLYEEMFFCTVENGGFFDFGDYGDSPDGRVSDDGLIEIKSVIASTHAETLKRGGFDPAYRWQIAGHFDSGCAWVDFVSYCADYPEWAQLAVYRVWRKDMEQEIAQLHERRAEFIELIRAKETEINQRKAA